MLLVFVGCDTDLVPKRSDAGQDQGDASSSEPDAGSGLLRALLDAPAAEEAGSLELDEPFSDVLHVADLALGLHEDGNASILDLSDPTNPSVISALMTTGRAISVAFDAELRILFILTIRGDLRAYRVADLTAPVQAAQLTVSEPGADPDSFRGLTRVGNRLFVLGQRRLVPVGVSFLADGTVSLAPETSIELDDSPERISAGGGVIYITFGGGRIQVWQVGSGAPTRVDEASLGADIVDWVVRGNRIFVALSGLGVRVVDLSVRGQLQILFEAPELDDITAIERFGNLILVAMQRGMLAAIDLSDISGPRPLVTRMGSLPAWIAPAGGNLVLGSAQNLTVFGVPPFVNASVPSLVRGAFPRYGRLPLQLSKPVDPATVTSTGVRLRCGSTVIEGAVVVSLDNLRITFVPSEPLPAGAQCRLSLAGVTDSLGLDLSSVASALDFTTMSQAPAAIDNPKSSFPHTADGAFTGWTSGMTGDFEYSDVTAARGMYSHFYADHDGTRLWMLNDWFYNGDDIDPDCYNQFGVWTGGGSERWDIRAYGDQRIEVRLNGTLLASDDGRVTGGYDHTATPNDESPHTVYEISIESAPGSWGVQLHDPGPSFGCEKLETDPTNYNGASTDTGSTVDPTMAPVAPTTPTPTTQRVTLAAPSLSWSSADLPSSFTAYLLEISTGDDLNNVIYRVWVYGQTVVLPAGLLRSGMTYTWRVTAYNLAGRSVSDPVTFTVEGDVQPVTAPTLGSVEPNSVVQGSGPAITINGQGFVEGAQAFFNGTALNTTFVSATQLMAMLDASLTQSVGVGSLTVRNLPADDATQSNSLELTITAQQQQDSCAHSECIPGAELPTTCSACAAAVCATTATCCNSSWTSACVDAADASASCACDKVTLSSITPGTGQSGTQIPITATLTNAPAGGNYLLRITDGVDAQTFACTASQANSCAATASGLAAGTYHVSVVVGPQGNTYETNLLLGALVISAAPAACAHNECLPGQALTLGCSACVTAVCTTTQACCSTGWDRGCVAAADAHGSCACTPPSLAQQNPLSPSGQLANATTQVTVTMQGEPAQGYTYQLQLTPVGGGTVHTFDCMGYSSVTHTCTATVSGISVTGPYNAVLTVSASGQTYFAPPLDSGFTVTAPVGCAHNECLPGVELVSTCSACATAVCSGMQTCCAGAWSEACVTAADSHGSCSCTPPSLVQQNSVSPSSQTASASTPVTVTMQDEPSPASGYTYALRLTRLAGGATQDFPCGNYNGTNHTCTATVSGLSMTGPYNAFLVVTAAGGQTYVSSPRDSAFTVNMQSGGGGMCITGTSAATVTGAGTCSNAYRIDLSGAQLGSKWHFAIADTFSNNEADATIGANTIPGECAAGTGRDIVIGISFPSGTQVGTLSAEGIGVNPIISVSSDNACGQLPITACMNATGVDLCETVNVLNPGSMEFYYVISEAVDSGQEIIISLTSV